MDPPPADFYTPSLHDALPISAHLLKHRPELRPAAPFVDGQVAGDTALLAELDGKEHERTSEGFRGANHDLVEQLVLFFTASRGRQRPRDLLERPVDRLRNGLGRLIFVGDLRNPKRAAQV